MDRKMLSAVVAALALALASCGGSSKPLSRADFAKQANTICKRRQALIATAQRQHRNDFRGAVKQALPGFTKSLDELASLKAPTEDKARLAEIISIEREQLARIQAAMAGRRQTQETTADIHKQANLKRELGLTSCV